MSEARCKKIQRCQNNVFEVGPSGNFFLLIKLVKLYIADKLSDHKNKFYVFWN